MALKKRYFVKFPKGLGKAKLVYATSVKPSKNYGFAFGGYKTKKEAIQVANYQGRNVEE